MNSFQVLTKKLTDDHKKRLDWFMENKNKEIKGWPKPLDNQLLLCKPKGIYKPREIEYALSIRTSINGPYDDKLIEHIDGKFEFSYFQENLNTRKRDLEYTNLAMNKCINDVIPVGVFVQIKTKPNPIYKVLGPAVVKSWKDGFYKIKGFSNIGEI